MLEIFRSLCRIFHLAGVYVLGVLFLPPPASCVTNFVSKILSSNNDNTHSYIRTSMCIYGKEGR